MPSTKLTDDQAEGMLRQLTEHFKQPVMPISKYCDAFRTWEKAIYARADRLKYDLYPGMSQVSGPEAEADWEKYKNEMADPSTVEIPRRWEIHNLKGFISAVTQVQSVSTMIRKSSLLARLLYGGEKLRPTMCPEHKGTWSGLEFPAMPGFDARTCEHGCNLIGWIPESVTPAPTPTDLGK
jgi:hypothetical protein